MGVLRQVKEQQPDLPVIILTADHEVDSVVDAMQGGAQDYIPKPLDRERLLNALRHASARAGIAAATGASGASAAQDAGLVGSSPAVRTLL